MVGILIAQFCNGNAHICGLLAVALGGEVDVTDAHAFLDGETVICPHLIFGVHGRPAAFARLFDLISILEGALVAGHILKNLCDPRILSRQNCGHDINLLMSLIDMVKGEIYL